MKIAYFTPMSPQRTGIADYSERELLPYLSRYCEIDIFIDTGVKPTNDYIKSRFRIYPYLGIDKQLYEYDCILYHMGNNPYHEFIYNTSINYPGIIILHDVFLHGFLWNISLNKGNKRRYIEEFEYCYGEKGTRIARKAIETGVFPDHDYPLIKRLLDKSIGVICHSEFGIKNVLNERNDSVVTKICHPLTIPPEIKNILNLNVDEIKLKHKLEHRFPIITIFGFIFPHKRIDVILTAFKKVLRQYPRAVLLLVGDDCMNIDKIILQKGLQNRVLKTGYCSLEKIIDYLAIADFCVNLRYPTAGETSGSVLRIMAAKKPVIVSTTGWFSELPNECCIKINVDESEEKMLFESMVRLASNEELRDTMGENALEYVQKYHDPEEIAGEYYEYIESVLNGSELLSSIMGMELAQIGCSEDDVEIIDSLSNNVKTLF